MKEVAAVVAAAATVVESKQMGPVRLWVEWGCLEDVRKANWLDE